PFRMKYAGPDQLARFRRGTVRNPHRFGAKQIYPLAVLRARHRSLMASITREERTVGRYVVMHRPFIALKMIPGAKTGRDFVSAQPENFAARSLEIVPDCFSVRAEE